MLRTTPHLVVLFIILKSTVSFHLDNIAATGCSLSPIELDPEVIISQHNYILYPEPGEETISVDVDEIITISCPGGTLSTGGSTTEATCVSGEQLEINNKNVYFTDITCSRKPFHTARKTGNSCELNGTEIEVGFVLDSENFIQQLLLCFNDDVQTSYYSKENLTKSIGSHESGVARPNFIEDDFYKLGEKVNTLYARDVQRSTLNNLIGLPASSTNYIKDDDHYLARGHLSPKADFVFAPEQTATFHYVNAAPQWQTFNGYNWERVESSVRDYAEQNSLDLIVYTGLYGVATLPHAETGEDTELYLYIDESTGEKALPVPGLYWKLVYDPASSRAVVLLGINNPYEENVGKLVICTDVIKELTWLLDNWDPVNIDNGYTYACDYNDFRNVVKHSPNLEVESLLV